MISYHLTRDGKGDAYARGFKAADVGAIKRLEKAVTGFVWSPCIWRDGVRKQDNFLRADWCVLDVDSPEMPLAEACKRFGDMVHIIGTTKSHLKDKGGVVCDRYRVMLLFERAITNLRDYRYTMSRVVRRYPVDQQPKDGARFFFPCTEIIQSSAEGYVEECLEAPETFEHPDQGWYEAYAEAGTLPPFARWALTSIIPVGERNTTFFRASKDLTKTGIKRTEIVQMIIASKTYGNQVSPDLVLEIESCVGNGIKAALRESADGREAQ